MIEADKIPPLKIVPVEKIPPAQSTPTDNLIDVYKTALIMRDFCATKKGKGMAAVQVGIPWDLFVMRNLPMRLRVNGDACGIFLRCQYEAIGGEQVDSIEGCLSLPGKGQGFRMFRVRRCRDILVQGLRIRDDGSLRVESFEERLGIEEDSIPFQHEIDHARGVLISDIGFEVNLW